MEKNLFRKATVLFFLAVLLTPFHCLSQQAVVSSGGEAEGSGGSISYTVGQIFYHTHGAGHTVSEGVQQPYEISVITAVSSDPGISLTVYPNPTRDFLQLQLEQYSHEKMEFFILDNQGRLAEKGLITSETTRIAMAHLEAGIYFLRVYRFHDHSLLPGTGKTQVITFRIVKH